MILIKIWRKKSLTKNFNLLPVICWVIMTQTSLLVRTGWLPTSMA